MRLLITIFIFAGVLFPVKAQIKSGSFQIDGDLKQINISANADFGKFRTDLSLEYNVAEEKINHYHADLNMEPADIYFAMEMSRSCDRPVDEVVEVYRVHRSHGWGEIAKELGIKPGSNEFHALKHKANNKSGSYKAQKGNKEKGNGKGAGKPHNKGKGK